MTVAAYRIAPLNNRIAISGYPQSGYMSTPANRRHEMRVERFRKWREEALSNIMREDMMLHGQRLNGREILDIDEVEIEKPRSADYES